MCISYTQCTVRLCQLHSQTLKPSFLRPPHTLASQLDFETYFTRSSYTERRVRRAVGGSAAEPSAPSDDTLHLDRPEVIFEVPSSQGQCCPSTVTPAAAPAGILSVVWSARSMCRDPAK